MTAAPESERDVIAAFYEIEQEKLLLDFRKIELFTRHPGSIGTFRERRLKQYLREVTPTQLSVGSGFISNWFSHEHNAAYVQSRQVDCLIFDETRNVPYLHTGDYTIIKPEAFYAAIEIKSNLTFFRQWAPVGKPTADFPLKSADGRFFRWAGTMVDAFENIKSISDVCGARPEKTFTGVFSYGLQFKLGTLYDAFDNGELQQQLGIKHVDELPSIVCIPGKAIIVLSGVDIFETRLHHDECRSFFNVIEATNGSPAYPLQFFTTFYYNQVHFKLNDAIPDKGGLFSANRASIRFWRRHFELNSEGYEDQ
jgi:hypothetical protein